MQIANVSATLVASLCLAQPAHAANWVPVTYDNNGTVGYIDTDSTQRIGQLVKYWEKINSPSTEK
jgi:hypothetical protein